MQRGSEPMQRISRRATGLVVLSLVAVACAVAASATTSTKSVVLLMLLYVCALATVMVASAGSRKGQPDHLVGGSGYVAPNSAAERVLHTAITLLYNGGIAVVVFAALVRFGVLNVNFSARVLEAFPIVLAGYLVLLAGAAGRRIVAQGGVRRAWYTRAHGWFLAAVSGPILGAGLVLALRGEVATANGVLLASSDFLILLLVGILGVGTQLLLAANLPTVFDLVSGVLRAVAQRRPEARETPPLVYALVLTVVATAVVGFVLVKFDLIGQLGSFSSRRVALVLALFPVAAAFFLAASALQIYRESRRGLYKKRIPTKLRNDLMVYGLSVLGGLGAASLLVLHLLGRLDYIGPLSGQGLAMDLIVLAVLATTAPIGLYMHAQNRRVDGIEARLPDFLNDLAETRRAGLTLTASLQTCALSDYGALTPEIRKMATQVAWGVPFTEALQQFADRAKTSLIRRSCSLIIEASRTGGSVADILKAAARDAFEIKSLEQDRRVAMMTYLIVIYVVFFVFLVVLVVLDAQFIPKVLAASEVSHQQAELTGGTGFGADASAINFADIHFAYFLGGIVQAVGNGLVGGILSEGRLTAGLRHTAIMASLVWLVFRVALGA